jgi:DNA polymerase-3 subunit delta
MSTLIYVLYGEDEVSLTEHLAALRAEVEDGGMGDLNVSVFDGRTVTESDLRAAIATAPFLAEARMVIVENLTDSAQGRALIDRADSLLDSVPEWSRVIFVETGLTESGERNRNRTLRELLKAIRKHPRAEAVKFDLPENVARWLQERAPHHGASIDSRAAAALTERIGGDMRLADVELAKLATYTGGERPIAAEDVALLTPYTPEANIFRMVDALGARDGRTAIRLLRQLLDGGSPPLYVFGMIVRQYRLILLMKSHLEGGGMPVGAAEALGLRDFVARKVNEQSRRYRIDQLERIYHHLFEIDLDIKTGRVEPELALDTLVGRLSG